MSKFAIYSPSNVLINYELASIGSRIFAFIIDLCLNAILLFILVFQMAKFFNFFIGEDYFLSLFIYWFFPIVFTLFYFISTEYYFEGRTIGKILLKIRTIRIDGEKPNFETFIYRGILLFFEFISSAGAIGLLAAASSPRRQRIGDRIAQTIVVKTNNTVYHNLQDLLALENKKPEVVYAEAESLTQEQALLIKEVIVKFEKYKSESLRKTVTELSSTIARQLEIQNRNQRPVQFLRQILKDYLLTTR